MTKTRGYQGKGPEVVLVGYEEVCCLGFAKDKHNWFKKVTPEYIDLAIKMGILEYRETKPGKKELVEIQPLPPEPQATLTIYNEKNPQDLLRFEKRWGDYIQNNTGLRRINLENCSFDPNNFRTFRSHWERKENLSLEQINFLKSCHIQLEDIEKSGDSYSATVVSVEDYPFPYPLDFGGPLPQGWRLDNLGLPAKEVRKMNPSFLLVYETAYRTLLHATLHPAQTKLSELYNPEDISLHTPTGFGPQLEIEAIGLATFHRQLAKPKQLSHSLANTILGYLAPSLGIKGKISTHIGACESCIGGLGDAYRDIKDDRFQGSLIIGYDWVMTAVAYNGFVANGAFITNEQILQAAKNLINDGILEDPEIQKEVHKRLEKDQNILDALSQVDKKMKAKEISRENAREQKARLQTQRLENFQNLPKKLYELASMPFHKYRNGFVMSLGAGGGFLTTLDFAVKNGLPIKAVVAGVAEKIPDGPGDGYGSIAVLGDGVGDAFERAFMEVKKNYPTLPDGDTTREVTIDDIGAWFAHGTSTPINGFGERREIHRILKKLGRNPEKPIFIAGDKEIGHRIGGNFPSEACYMLEEGTIYPFKNYTVADEEVDREFPLTQVVGKAGAGQGNPMELPGEFVAINGAGFGKINSNLIFKKFRLEDLDISEEEKAQYQSQCAKRQEQAKIIQQKIRRNEIPLVQEVTETARSRGEKSELAKLIEKNK